MNRRESFRHERRKIKNQAGGFSHISGGLNWPMPPRIIIPPTARLTSRLCNTVFLRSAFKAQKPLRSRAKDCLQVTIESKGKTKNIFQIYSGDGRRVEGRGGVGGVGGGGIGAAINIQDIRIVHRVSLPACAFLIEGR